MVRIGLRSLGVALAATATLLAQPLAAAAADCARATTGLVPITALGTGSYEGEQGGLYPGGTNEPPRAYADAGIAAAAALIPRDAQGGPDPSGKIVLVSIGMSNATQEFSAFVTLAAEDAARDAHVLVVDGAQGGQTAAEWADPKARMWSVVDQRLAKAGVTAAQVQSIWLKGANARPKDGVIAYVDALERDLAANVRVAADHFANLQQVFVSPRTYGGYASTGLNPEPYAYATGFAVKRVVSASVERPHERPWVGWGPYLWADGVNPNSEGLAWACADFKNDGTHPSESGREKVAVVLQHHFATSPFTTWYRGGAVSDDPSAAAGASGSPDAGLVGDDAMIDPRVAVAGLGGVLALAIAFMIYMRFAMMKRRRNVNKVVPSERAG